MQSSREPRLDVRRGFHRRPLLSSHLYQQPRGRGHHSILSWMGHPSPECNIHCRPKVFCNFTCYAPGSPESNKDVTSKIHQISFRFVFSAMHTHYLEIIYALIKCTIQKWTVYTGVLQLNTSIYISEQQGVLQVRQS